MEKQRVYSPTQAASGAFLGGPIAAVLFLKQNFRALGNPNGESKVRIYGAAFVLLVFGIAPFLPEEFPNMAIPLATVITTRLVVEKYQVSKQAIVESELLEFHSNWRVLGVSLACLVASFAILFALIVGLDAFGIAIPA